MIVNGYEISPLANLIGVYLHCADLSGANFNGASLTSVDLIEANLRVADLVGVNLTDNIRG